MRDRRHGFTTLNMSGPQVRQLFVVLILGTAVVFVLAGLFAMLQAERSAHTPYLGNVMSHFSTETLLYLMGGELPYLTSMPEVADKEPPYSRIFFELVTSINPEDPRSFLGSELPGFALFDTEIAVAGEGVDYTSVPIESPPPPDMEDQLNDDGDSAKEEQEPPAASGEKKVFIYHTHFTESYLPDLSGTNEPNRAFDKKKNITLVGTRLGKMLERHGLGAEVSTRGYNAEWNQLYKASRETVVQAMKQHDDLQYILDLHRDSQRRKATTKEIEGETYAQFAFVIGTGHKDWEKNERFAMKLHKKLDELYPGISRGVFRKTPMMGNGEYNQSLAPNSVLVEVGGVDNSFEEAYRSADALAQVLAEIHFDAVPVDAQPDKE